MTSTSAAILSETFWTVPVRPRCKLPGMAARAARAGVFARILLTGTVLWATPALAVDIVNRDAKAHTVRVVDTATASRMNVPAYTTQMSVCWSCRIEVQGMGQVDARPGQTVIITGEIVYTTDPVRPGTGYVPSKREQLGLGAPPIAGIESGLPQWQNPIPDYRPRPLNPIPQYGQPGR